jgi:CheY-like chemotaxis protein
MTGRRAARPRALVVDDHEAGRLLARLVLERLGLAADVAADAAECAARLAARRYDIILVDRVLGETDGLALAAELAAREPAAVIVVSGLRPPEALPPGLAGWLTKPYTPRQMYGVVATALAGSGKSIAHERIV